MNIKVSSRTIRRLAMPISKLGQRRQVVIPKQICDELGLREGDFVEVTSDAGKVVIKPKKLVDADDILTPEEEELVRKGEAELRKRKHVPWGELKKQLSL
jgi:AbrB family looped-hinge helix DNA binding protein